MSDMILNDQKLFKFSKLLTELDLSGGVFAGHLEHDDVVAVVSFNEDEWFHYITRFEAVEEE